MRRVRNPDTCDNLVSEGAEFVFLDGKRTNTTQKTAWLGELVADAAVEPHGRAAALEFPVPTTRAQAGQAQGVGPSARTGSVVGVPALGSLVA